MTNSKTSAILLSDSDFHLQTWYWIAGAIAIGGTAGAFYQPAPPVGSAIGAIGSGVLTWLIREGGHLFKLW